MPEPQGTEKVLVVDPFSGASGDMLLAGLIDLGLPATWLQEQIRKVPVLAAVELSATDVRRGMFRARRLEFHLPEGGVERNFSQVETLLCSAPLPEEVRVGATAAFRLLAQAEAKVHGTSLEEVKFHEVGALDSICDILGWHLGLAHLGSPPCYHTSIPLGTGSVKCAHGEIPVPAPATLELLEGREVFFSGRRAELVTPTAAAVLAASCSPLPADLHLIPEKVGYGAGSREERDGLPDVLRIVLGAVETRPGKVGVIATTIDDMNPEIYGTVMEGLFSAGALEVYFNQVMMKKNRPGLEVTVLCEPDLLDHLASFLLEHTTTIGLRIRYEQRRELPRRVETVSTPYGPIRVKVAQLPGGREKVSPEFESCRRAAGERGATVMEVYDAARIAWERESADEA